jgi:hypothetical protein
MSQPHSFSQIPRQRAPRPCRRHLSATGAWSCSIPASSSSLIPASHRRVISAVDARPGSHRSDLSRDRRARCDFHDYDRMTASTHISARIPVRGFATRRALLKGIEDQQEVPNV